jgi:hypothetical protein
MSRQEIWEISKGRDDKWSAHALTKKGCGSAYCPRFSQNLLAVSWACASFFARHPQPYKALHSFRYGL